MGSLGQVWIRAGFGSGHGLCIAAATASAIVAAVVGQFRPSPSTAHLARSHRYRRSPSTSQPGISLSLACVVVSNSARVPSFRCQSQQARLPRRRPVRSDTPSLSLREGLGFLGVRVLGEEERKRSREMGRGAEHGGRENEMKETEWNPPFVLFLFFFFLYFATIIIILTQNKFHYLANKV